MLLATIQLDKYGLFMSGVKGPENIQQLGFLKIINDGTGDNETANYQIILEREGQKREVEVKGHKRSDGWLVLMEKVFHEINEKNAGGWPVKIPE